MSALFSTPSIINNAESLVCLVCGDPFTPHGLAGGVLPILFSCGHTVCTECAEAAALSLPVSSIKWACGIPSCIANPTAGGDNGCVNAGLVALVQCDAGPPAEPATLADAMSSKKRKRCRGKSEAALDFSALCDEAESAIAFSLSDVDRVNTARRTMREGFESSKRRFIADIDSLLSAIIAHRDRVLGEATRLFDAREKALEAQVEELSVKVSLLRQAVDVCNAAIAGSVELTPEVYESVRKGVKGLTGTPFGGLAVCPVAGLGVDIEAALEGFEANVYVKRGVSASHCEMSGRGLDNFLPGDCDSSNVFTLMCRDDRSDAVDVDAREVNLRVLPFTSADDGLQVAPLSAAWASMISVDGARGVFKAEYAVVSEDVSAVDIDVRVYGEVVQHCPVRVQLTLFPLSTVLSVVDPATLRLFTRGMRSWLPTPRKPEVLFRMSRDGTSTSDFHSRCDGKGPTVVLILSSNGFAFGGYADKAWHNEGYPNYCADSFIFTVSNPHGIPPTRYLVNNSARALYGYPDFGPVFGGWAIHVGDEGSLTSGCSTPFRDYTDTTGKGKTTFTGDYSFTPAEVEVWRV